MLFEHIQYQTDRQTDDFIHLVTTYCWFCSASAQEKCDPVVKKEVDGMGVPDIKYGDSVCYIQHVDTCLWLTYQTIDAKCARMGGVQRKVKTLL